MMTVCALCNKKMQCEEIGVYYLELLDDGSPYRLWACDLYKCHYCNNLILNGFSNKPVAGHWDADFGKQIEKIDQSTKLFKERM